MSYLVIGFSTVRDDLNRVGVHTPFRQDGYYRTGQDAAHVAANWAENPLFPDERIAIVKVVKEVSAIHEPTGKRLPAWPVETTADSSENPMEAA